ncbi:MAG: DUF86 domain-containing protein [Candidatus Auribacterota bacterium]
MSRDYTLYIHDIITCIERIEEFTAGMNYEQFMADDKTCSAVIRKLEVIGEASKCLPESITGKYSEIPWKDMARMRDKIIHFYFGVDTEIVWNVIKNRLPDIKLSLRKIYESLKK